MALISVLELTLCRNVEKVVGLVEEQYLRVGGEQQVEHEALSLAARERGRRPVADLGESSSQDASAGGVPLALELVAPEVGPGTDGLAEPDAGGGVARDQLALCGQHRQARRAHALRRHREQQRPDGTAVLPAHLLGHVGGSVAVRDGSLGRFQLPREDPQQRALADAVGADQARVPPGRQPKGHPLEEQVAPWVRVGEVRHRDMAHSSMNDPMVTMRCSGRQKNSTGLVEVRDRPRNNFLRQRLMPGPSPRTSVIWEMK